MTREEKIALCRKLKGEGLTVRAIARQTGIPRATVGVYLVGDEHERARKAQSFPPCVRCGGARYSHEGATRRLCRGCIHDDAVTRARMFERLWNEGNSLGAIADAIGTTLGTVCSLQDRYRAQGYHLPYRYTTGKRAGRKFPERTPA